MAQRSVLVREGVDAAAGAAGAVVAVVDHGEDGLRGWLNAEGRNLTGRVVRAGEHEASGTMKAPRLILIGR